jgi:multidrug efflux pump subunit AcrA (membrane-fusion protein)
MPKRVNVHNLLLVVLFASIIFAGCESLPSDLTSFIPSQATPTKRPNLYNDIEPIVSATGEVVPAQWSSLSVATAGVIEEILVSETDKVEEGQGLVLLKGTKDLQARIASANYEVQSAQKVIDDLYENNDAALTEALQRISEQTIQMKASQYQLEKRFTLPQNQKDLERMEALDLMKEVRDEVWARYEPYKNRLDTDAVKEKLQDELDEAESDYNAAVTRIEYENELEVAQNNLQQSREDFLMFSEGPDPVEVAFAEARLENANVSLSAAEAALEDLALLAPFTGTVTEVNVNTNEWVNPGKGVILLADLDHLHIETIDLNEIDAARLNIGDRAIVTFDAFPDLTLGGTVIRIAQKSDSGSSVNYKVVIQLDEIPDNLRWDMTAFVDIEVNE